MENIIEKIQNINLDVLAYVISIITESQLNDLDENNSIDPYFEVSYDDYNVLREIIEQKDNISITLSYKKNSFYEVCKSTISTTKLKEFLEKYNLTTFDNIKEISIEDLQYIENLSTLIKKVTVQLINNSELEYKITEEDLSLENNILFICISKNDTQIPMSFKHNNDFVNVYFKTTYSFSDSFYNVLKSDLFQPIVPQYVIDRENTLDKKIVIREYDFMTDAF